MNPLCRIGIHIEKFLTCNVAGGSRCSCGKKSTPPLVWPRCEGAQQNAMEDLQTVNQQLKRAIALLLRCQVCGDVFANDILYSEMRRRTKKEPSQTSNNSAIMPCLCGECGGPAGKEVDAAGYPLCDACAKALRS